MNLGKPFQCLGVDVRVFLVSESGQEEARMSAAGQTINDRILAARHSLAGQVILIIIITVTNRVLTAWLQGLAKAVCKATTEEIIGPKKKHLDCE